MTIILLVLVLRSTLGYHGQVSVKLEYHCQVSVRLDNVKTGMIRKINIRLVSYLVRRETMYIYRGFALLQGSDIDSS
jgi:hypothetical protein